MEVDHKALIDKNYMLFTELLRLKSIPLIRYLYDEQVLTEGEATKTISQAAHTLRTMHMLDNLMKLGPEEFNSLYAAILYTKLWRAADLMEPKKKPHQAIIEEKQIPLPDVWPDEGHFENLKSKELEIKKVDPNDARMEEWYEQSKKNNIYDMKGTIKGRVLIINNHEFKRQKPRHGSIKDVEGLEKVFSALGFKTEPHQDLDCIQMQELLDRECEVDHTPFKCFFLIIMSHGDKGVVYGTDGYTEGNKPYNSLSIENIKNQFYNVKSLERKPKVFIYQACQGSGKDSGLKERKAQEEEDEEEIEELPDESTQPDGHDPVKDGNKGAADDGNEAAEEGNQGVDEEDNEGSELSGADMSDEEDDEHILDEIITPQDNAENADGITAEAPFHFLVAMATTEGNLSYRNSVYGSWFIQAFIFVLANYAWKEDLLTLMEKVNALVRRAKTERTKRISKHYLQVSQITNTFIKRLFFFPGMRPKK